METDCIPFKQTTYFSKLICDYLDEKESLKFLYNRFPRLEGFKDQILEKQSAYPEANRKVLQQSLKGQYSGVDTSKLTQNNIDALANPATFTVVTGHQLNLFTGPLYFLYKIISTINLSKELKKAYPEYNFVPVYWMATEDHDFEEINYFNFGGKKLQWNHEASGAVGQLKTEGLDEVYKAFSNELGNSINATTLKQWFNKAYLEHQNLTDATRYLANALFGEYGLVILDGDDSELKKLLIPYVKKDLLEKTSFRKVSGTIAKWQEDFDDYGIQVNPREINYFYLANGIRERILEKEGRFYVNETPIEFSKEEIILELEKYPERFSPNVITRPLYQEVILPNLCYIGGGGELAYWLEFKAMFDAMEVPFPILLLRNSALVVSSKQYKKIEKLNLSLEDLFMEQNSFINKKIRKISNIEIDLSVQKQHLQQQFEALYSVAEQTDKSFVGAVKAQEAKQLKGIDALEKRLLKAQKRKLRDHVVRMTDIQNELFPGQSLQERNLNFSELYLELGEDLIPLLIQALKPLHMEFLVLRH